MATRSAEANIDDKRNDTCSAASACKTAPTPACANDRGFEGFCWLSSDRELVHPTVVRIETAQSAGRASNLDIHCAASKGYTRCPVREATRVMHYCERRTSLLAWCACRAACTPSCCSIASHRHSICTGDADRLHETSIMQGLQPCPCQLSSAGRSETHGSSLAPCQRHQSSQRLEVRIKVLHLLLHYLRRLIVQARCALVAVCGWVTC
jgi:hypothetical protein